MGELRNKNLATLAAGRADIAAEEQAKQEEEAAQPLNEPKTEEAAAELDEAAKKAKAKAVKEKLKEQARLARERKEEEERLRQERLETINKTKDVVGIATQTAQSFNDVGARAYDRLAETASGAGKIIASANTPGGLFLPITLLLIFFFVLLPVGGNTRAKWLWKAMIGQSHIKGYGGEASGDFTPSPSPSQPSQPQTSAQPFILPGNLPGLYKPINSGVNYL